MLVQNPYRSSASGGLPFRKQALSCTECYSNHPPAEWSAITSPNDSSSPPPLHERISFSRHGNETPGINFSSEVRGGEKVHLIRRGIFSMPDFGFGGSPLTG
ncbi:hypothetical protein CDAR_222091 [Caerostris darwini]|uniref:Uncharacterized protein n=1 Tax=Caerostris darwini TaxID=1538125 RepID=A0AAV4V0Q7_9ARAC|nr:hypothetical protein CDAR_222091 [Caerostris darwini]